MHTKLAVQKDIKATRIIIKIRIPGNCKMRNLSKKKMKTQNKNLFSFY